MLYFFEIETSFLFMKLALLLPHTLCPDV